MLVCDDPALLETDRHLAALYDTASSAGVPMQGALTESAFEWLRRRSLCAFSVEHRACVVAAYRERISVVEALLGARASPGPLIVRCGVDRWRGRQLHTAAGLDALILGDEDGLPVGVALAAAEGPDWRAFVSYQPAVRGRELTLALGDDRRTCALSTSLGTLPDAALRQRVEAIDELVERARAARDSRRLEAAAFAGLVQWLCDQEATVHAEARLRTFADPATDNYWHRGRLKFPTLAEQELSRLPQRR